MIQYLIQIVYIIQYKLEDQYLKKLIKNILKLRYEYHLLSEQEFQKLWIKTKKTIKDNGIKKILLNNYLFIIYRSFLGNIGLHYIYKKKKKKKNFSFLFKIMRHDFITIQQISIIIELYCRILKTTPTYKEIYFFLQKINFLQINKNFIINIKNNINIYYIIFLYNQLINIENNNIIIEQLTKENLFLKESFYWFFEKQNLYSNHNILQMNTKKELYTSFFKRLDISKNQDVKKQKVYFFINNIYTEVNTKNQWNKIYIIKHDTHLYKNKTSFEIINYYFFKINPIFKKNLKKDSFLFEHINQSNKLFKHPFEISFKPYIRILQKQNQITNKKLIWEKNVKKEIQNELFLHSKIILHPLQNLTHSFFLMNNNFLNELLTYQTNIQNKIIIHPNIYLQIKTLLQIIQTSISFNYIIIVETKQFLYLLIKILSIHKRKWYLLIQEEIDEIFTKIQSNTNKQTTNIFITNLTQINENIEFFQNKKNNFFFITTEFLNHQIEYIISKHIYLLFWNNDFFTYCFNKTNNEIIQFIPKQNINTHFTNFKNIITTNTNKQTLLNKEYLKNIQEIYLIQSFYRFLIDLQIISKKKLYLYQNFLKTIFLKNIYIDIDWSTHKKNTYTLNQIIQETIIKNNLKKNKKIEFLGIHIQKKNKLNKKKDCQKIIISLHNNKTHKDNFSSYKNSLHTSFIQLLTNLKNNKNNNNRKITKNDEFLFLLQIIQIYKNFLYQLLLIKLS